MVFILIRIRDRKMTIELVMNQKARKMDPRRIHPFWAEQRRLSSELSCLSKFPKKIIRPRREPGSRSNLELIVRRHLAIISLQGLRGEGVMYVSKKKEKSLLLDLDLISCRFPNFHSTSAEADDIGGR